MNKEDKLERLEDLIYAVALIVASNKDRVVYGLALDVEELMFKVLKEIGGLENEIEITEFINSNAGLRKLLNDQKKKASNTGGEER
jgi:hypothetical protein